MTGTQLLFVAVLYILAAVAFAAHWKSFGGRIHEVAGPQRAPYVVVASTPAPRPLGGHERRGLPALSEDDVIAFGRALEATSDVMPQLRPRPHFSG